MCIHATKLRNSNVQGKRKIHLLNQPNTPQNTRREKILYMHHPRSLKAATPSPNPESTLPLPPYVKAEVPAMQCKSSRVSKSINKIYLLPKKSNVVRIKYIQL
jgi:hypothetical protein